MSDFHPLQVVARGSETTTSNLNNITKRDKGQHVDKYMVIHYQGQIHNLSAIMLYHVSWYCLTLECCVRLDWTKLIMVIMLSYGGTSRV